MDAKPKGILNNVAIAARNLGRLLRRSQQVEIVPERTDFPRLVPVAKYPPFRMPPLSPPHILGLSLEVVRQGFLPLVKAGYVDSGLPMAQVLEEMYRDREWVIKRPMDGVAIQDSSGRTTEVKINKIEIRLAQPILERLYAESLDWKVVSEALADRMPPAIQYAIELQSGFTSQLDELRAYTFLLEGAPWGVSTLLPSRMALYVHWLSTHLYVVVGETRDDFDDWVRFGRMAEASRGLFN